MSNKVISMQLVRTLIQLLEKGFSLRHISRELKLSRKTVTLYSTRLQSSDYTLIELRQLNDAVLASIVYAPASIDPSQASDPRKEDFLSRIDYFITELKRPGVTRLLLWQEYSKENAQGFGYTQFCVLLSNHRKNRDLSMHLDYKPAEVMMVDFAGDKISYIDKSTAEMITCPVLVCVLPYSGFSFVTALNNASIPQLVKALNRCLEFFEGVPMTLKTDNMKQIVYKSCRYEPVFSQVMQEWAHHYNIDLITARVAKPKDKAPVENEVKLTYQRIYAPLRDKEFFNLAELNIAISEQARFHHDKLFQRKKYSRRICFETEEKSFLQPLPPTPFELKHRVQAKVQKNYHITLGEDWHHYSVPYQHVGKTVTVVYDTDIVEIYLEHQRIALHKRSYKSHGYSTTSEHMPEGHQRYFEQKGWTADYFLGQGQKIGKHAYQYIQGVLKEKRFTEQTYNACRGLLRLAKDYGLERMEAACKRALQGKNYNYHTIHNILLNNLDKQSPEQGDLFQMPDHDNLRGPQAYE